MKILYALSGHGFGHATRSQVVIEWLKKEGHLVKIITYGQSLSLMKENFSQDTFEIKGFRQYYFKDRLLATVMMTKILKGLPKALIKNIPLIKKIIKNFQIDLIISDFEPFSRYLAKKMKIPLITIDNQSTLKFCRFKIPVKFLIEYFSAKILVDICSLSSNYHNYHFVPSFSPELLSVKEKFSHFTFIVPPILRAKIFSLTIRKNDFILFYQTAPLYQKHLLNLFSQLSQEKFICYNLEKADLPKNVMAKKFSEDNFLKDLSSCKAVIINGGFTLMSEAIYLKKPILSLPIKGDFEQIFNALILKESGYGLWSQKIKKEVLEKFISQLSVFENKLINYQQEKNIIFEKKLKEVLSKIQAGVV